MAKAARLLLLFTATMATSNALQCYVDTQGIKRPEDGDLVDVHRFKKVNCTNVSGNADKPCMTRTDLSGIVRRNCATIKKERDVCEADVDGNILCYCLTNLCNHAQQLGEQRWASLLPVLMTLLTLLSCSHSI